MKSKFSLVVCIISITLSVMAICIVLPRTDLAVDYLGLLTGILGILVTVLIGWNIYTIIDFKQEKERLHQYFEMQKDSVHKVGNDLRTVFMNRLSQSSIHDKNVADIYAQLMGIQRSNPLSFYYLFYTLNAITTASQAENYQACNLWVMEITQVLPSPKDVLMPKSSKQRLVDCVLRIPNYDKIENLGKVLSLIAEITAIPDPE